MKKSIIVLSTLAVAALALVSCTKEQEVNIVEEPQGVPFEIVAGSIDAKTINDGDETHWVSGDQINLFHAVHGEASYENDGAFSATADGKSVSFTGTLASAPSSGTYDWFAVYPYSAGFSTPAGTAAVTIPAAQTQAGNSSKAHLAGANCPVAGNVKEVAFDATPVVAFKHLTSIIKVHVTNKTTSPITVSGVSFTTPIKINGAFDLTLTGDNPVLSGEGGSATTALTVTSGSPLAADASADFYLAVKPIAVTANDQITLTVNTDAGDQTLTTVLPTNYTFVAGKIATLNFNFTNKPVTLAQFKYNDPDWLDAQSITKPLEGSWTNLTSTTQTVGEITLSSTDGTTATRVFNKKDAGYDLRVYSSGGSFTLSSTDSYLISKIAIAESGIASSATFGGNAANFAVSCGTKTGNTKNVTWTGLSQDVTFTVSNTVQIGTITVFYQATTASDHVVSLPVKTKGVAYNATSTSLSLKTVNVDDLVITSASEGYVSYSHAGSTLTVNMTANASSSPRDIVVNVASASAGFDEDITITQDGAPTKINTLTASSTGVTVTAQVTALTTKGFIITDDTASIFVYTNSDVTSTYTIGQSVTVAGNVSVNNLGLQFNAYGGDATVTPGADGSYDYPAASVYSLSDVTSYIADGSNRLATYVQYTGVIPSSTSTYVNVCVGGVATANAGSYNISSTLKSGVSKGDYVTVKGYAMSVSGGRMTVCVTSITKDADAPGLVFNDITGVSAAGVGSTDHTITPYRVTGWTPSLVSKPSWVSSATPAGDCTKLTYAVEENGITERSGEIVIRLTRDLNTYDYTIKITQEANLRNETIQFSTLGLTNNTQYTSFGSGSPANLQYFTISFTGGSNDGKYYDTGTGIRTYGGGSMTIASESNTICKIEFTWHSTYKPEADVATPTGYSTVTETWEGSANSVVLARPSGSGHWRLQKVKVSFSD